MLKKYLIMAVLGTTIVLGEVLGDTAEQPLLGPQTDQFQPATDTSLLLFLAIVIVPSGAGLNLQVLIIMVNNYN